RTRSFTSSIAADSASASSFGRCSRWNASRCAVRVPTPGRRESCATRFSTAGLSTSLLCRHAPDCRGWPASGREAAELVREPWILGQEPFDLRPRDRQATDVGLRPHPRGALDVVAQERSLPEDVSRPDLAPALRGFDDRLSLLEYEDSRARLAALDQGLAGGGVELRCRRGEPVELRVVQVGEERQCSQPVAHYPPSPGRPRPPSPPASPPIFDSIKLCAERTASLTAPAPFATTVTMPPPAVACTVSFASSSCAFCISLCISPTCCSNLSMSMP